MTGVKALNSDVERLRKKLDRDPRQLDDIGRLYARHIALGQPFPADLEEHSLKLILEFVRPDDDKVARRLCFLRLQQGRHLTECDIEKAFPENIGEEEIYSFLAPLYESLPVEEQVDHFDLPSCVLHQRFPDCRVCLYFRASFVHRYRDSKQALDLLEKHDELCRKTDFLSKLHAEALSAYLKGRPSDGPEAVRTRQITPVAFIHVFKSGGTSASDWIAAQFPANSCFVPDDTDNFREISLTSDLDRYELVRGHIFIGDALNVFRRPRTIFTLIREPEARVMSLLWHLHIFRLGSGDTDSRTHAAFDPAKYKAAASISAREIPQFVYFLHDPSLLDQWLNGIATREQVVASMFEGLGRVDVIGITERLADSLRVLAWRMRWPAPRYIGNTRRSGAGQQKMSDDLKRQLADLLHIDTLLYDQAHSRFLADFAAIAQAAGGEDKIDVYLDSQAACVETVSMDGHSA